MCAHWATTSSITTNFTNITTAASAAKRFRRAATGTTASTVYQAALACAAERVMIAAKRYNTTGLSLRTAEPLSQILREVTFNHHIPGHHTLVVTANSF